MLHILISGCNGHMGQILAGLCGETEDLRVVGGFDLLGRKSEDFPVWNSPAACTVEGDVVVDFSSPSALPALLDFGLNRNIPLVLCTTGYTQDQIEAVAKAAQQIPIFRSANMSLGINVLSSLVAKAAAALEGFDVEIVERHHNRKLDAPSGTALLLADAATRGLPYEPTPVYGRSDVRRPRGSHEIGISSVRGGNIVGDHTVIFAGRDEVIELSHSALSRDVFASGALRAAYFLVRQAPGLYNMDDLIKEIL